jgi:hypothetical protein
MEQLERGEYLHPLSVNGKKLTAILAKGPCVIDDKSIRAKLLKITIKKNLPLNFTDDEDFRDLSRWFGWRGCIPSREVIQSSVSSDFEVVKFQVENYLSKTAGPINIRADVWTSNNSHQFIGILGQFLDNFGKLQTILLDFVPLLQGHNSEIIKACISQTLTDWQLWSKLGAFTTDAGSDMIKAIRLILVERNMDPSLHVTCMAHAVHLAASEMINCPIVSNLHMLLNQVVTFLRASPHRMEKLRELCAAADLLEETINHDGATRWSSFHALIQRFLKLRPHIEAMLDLFAPLSDEEREAEEEAVAEAADWGVPASLLIRIDRQSRNGAHRRDTFKRLRLTAEE